MSEGTFSGEARTAKFEVSPFDTSFLGFKVDAPVLKNMDWLEKHRDDAHIVRSVREYLDKGVKSRKERFGELGGRMLSGYWKEPQNEIHVHVPSVVLGSSVGEDPRENWRLLFEASPLSKAGYKHRMYALLDTEHTRRDNYKDRFNVIPDSTPPREREVKAFFVRSELFNTDTLRAIKDTASAKNIPLINVETLSRL